MYILKKTAKALTALTLAVVVAIAGLLSCLAADGKPIGTLNSFEYIPNSSYNEYIEENAGILNSDVEFEFSTLDYDEKNSIDTTVKNLLGFDTAFVSENGKAVWKFTVPKTGAYNIEIEYYAVPGKTTPIKFALGIDGVYPFSSVESISLSRVWKDVDEIIKDTQGNEIKPSADEVDIWQKVKLTDTSGFSQEPYKFFLTEGEHTLSVESIQNELVIKTIRFLVPESTPTYEEKLNEWASLGYKDATTPLEPIQAEDMLYKSDKSITVVNDRASPMTYPSDAKTIIYNCTGNGWGRTGQWIDWEVNVPEAGLYTMVLRFKQSGKVNDISSRTIYIDGELPFAEAKNVSFDYASGWQVSALSAENGTPYKFYLSEGKHTIRMEVSLGDYSSVLYEVNQILGELNNIYRKFLMITGSSPDVDRDYEFDILIPEVLEEMKAVSQKLKDIEVKVEELTSGGGQSTAVFTRLYKQLDAMYEDHVTIAKRFANFKSNITALGTWINDGRSQPLTIDYIQFSNTSTALPKAEKNFFEVLGYYIEQFFHSFVMDYSIVGNIGNDADKEITVWIATGRDQADIIRQMANDTFTPKYGISANIQLVNAGALLPATLAGIGPDVYLGMDETSPVNYALRGAVADLSKLDGIDEVLDRFYESSILPFRLDGGVYAIPETISYPMLFYRKDILTDLGIVEDDLKTWDSLLQKVLPELDMNYFKFGLLPTVKSYAMFLYQNGGEFYTSDNTASALDSQVALTAFQQLTTLYADYGLDIAFDFSNRFRSGEMPLAIVEFTSYNQMSVFAPEIDGLWSMMPVPGIVDEDGNIQHQSVSTITGTVILSRTDDIDSAWEFVKWWSSAEIQSRYGTDLETVMGTGARYASANVEAMETVQWDKTVATALKDQLETVVSMPQIAGSYFTTRHFDFAFRDVYYQGVNAREALADASEDITNEIHEKRAEFYGEKY